MLVSMLPKFFGYSEYPHLPSPQVWASGSFLWMQLMLPAILLSSLDVLEALTSRSSLSFTKSRLQVL